MTGRPAPADRHFSRPAIEASITRIKEQIADPKIAMMFERYFPNTLDTTIFPETQDGQPDTFVITGDIDAMWLRDSTARPGLIFSSYAKIHDCASCWRA